MSSKFPVEELFSPAILEKRLLLPITQINQQFETHVLNQLRSKTENRCIEEGYVLASSLKLSQTSVGKITAYGVEVIAVFSCKICCPVEGMIVECTVSDVTKAGVHADCYTENRAQHPLTVYILRDHFYDHPYFKENGLQKDQKIRVKIIGVRYELNDPCIHAIAEFVEKDDTSGSDSEDEDDEEEDTASDSDDDEVS